MPNGGFVWSCAICKSGRTDEYPDRQRFWCKQHKLEILFDPDFKLCAEIALTKSIDEYDIQKKRLSKVMHSHKDELKSGGIYVYLQVWHEGYRGKIVRLASISEYAKWTRQQDYDRVMSETKEWQAHLATTQSDDTSAK